MNYLACSARRAAWARTEGCGVLAAAAAAEGRGGWLPSACVWPDSPRWWPSAAALLGAAWSSLWGSGVRCASA